jgi:hypothetical protein
MVEELQQRRGKGGKSKFWSKVKKARRTTLVR